MAQVTGALVALVAFLAIASSQVCLLHLFMASRCRSERAPRLRRVVSHSSKELASQPAPAPPSESLLRTHLLRGSTGVSQSLMPAANFLIRNPWTLFSRAYQLC